MLRNQAVTFLARYFDADLTDLGENPYTDVADGSWYHDYVLWATDHNITNGTYGATFSPNDDCLRGQIVTFLYRAFQGIPEA